MENIIAEFIGKADNLIISKFYINLPPEVNRYLEWWASTYRKPKVDRIRRLIENDIENNKEWQKYIH